MCDVQTYTSSSAGSSGYECLSCPLRDHPPYLFYSLESEVAAPGCFAAEGLNFILSSKTPCYTRNPKHKPKTLYPNPKTYCDLPAHCALQLGRRMKPRGRSIEQQKQQQKTTKLPGQLHVTCMCIYILFIYIYVYFNICVFFIFLFMFIFIYNV